MKWPAGYALRQLETVDSTNAEARRMADDGVAGPIWISADRQTAGRGRRGRQWAHREGNLAATLLMRPGRSAREAAQLSFAAALAVADTVAYYAPACELRVKWPNDVLLAGRKVSGILLESAGGEEGRLAWLAVGIGINLAHHPDDAEFPATSIAAVTGGAPPRDGALARLATAWAKWYEDWMREGFSALRDPWLARAAALGGRIRARLSGEELEGVFEGIDADGALILRQPGGVTRLVAAGDVFFPGVP